MRRIPLLVAALLAVLAATPTTARANADEAVPPQVQTAVDRGLEWLAAKQDRATGAWSSANGPSVAITSLSTMAFLARGHTPGQGPYGDLINRGIDFVLASQRDNGVLMSGNFGGHHSMYDHGIGAMMLCEVYGMLDDERQAKAHIAVSKATRLILDAQRVRKSPQDQGGWRYTPTSNDSDISVSGWQMMALRGAANIGAAVPKAAIDDGISYLKRRSIDSGGFSYVGGSSANSARTATGILCLELLGEHHSKEALAGGDYLLRNPIRASNEFYYYSVYYVAQAANQLGGKYWTGLNPTLRENVLQRQRAADGSWSVSNTIETQGGDAYGTSMAILALTVPYRYLPIYQRH